MIFLTISILLLIALLIPTMVCSRSKESASIVSSAKDTEAQDVEQEPEESDEEEEEE